MHRYFRYGITLEIIGILEEDESLQGLYDSSVQALLDAAEYDAGISVAYANEYAELVSPEKIVALAKNHGYTPDYYGIRVNEEEKN